MIARKGVKKRSEESGRKKSFPFLLTPQRTDFGGGDLLHVVHPAHFLSSHTHMVAGQPVKRSLLWSEFE